MFYFELMSCNPAYREYVDSLGNVDASCDHSFVMRKKISIRMKLLQEFISNSNNCEQTVAIFIIEAG
uniref:Uncharacterized protein n=1 Tax=Leersia perrieri TaxID=77586 RepID=A0A0D9V8W0_9ORYZ